MTPSLSNQFFQFEFMPDTGQFDISSASANFPAITGCLMQVDLRYENRAHSIPLNHWEITGTNTEEITDPQHGVFAQLPASSNIEFFGLQMQVVFALARTEPLFLWKIQITNGGENPVWINKIEFLRAGGQSQHGSLRFSENPTASGWSFYSNGWQSWSHTGTYLPGQAMRISRLGRFQQPMVVNPGTPLLRLPNYYTSEFFGAISDLNSGAGLAIGFLSQKQHFGTVEAVLYDKPSLALFTADGSLLESGTVLETDWAVISPFSITDPDPFRVYLEAVARENEVKRIPEQSVPSGWCSWYQYYTNLNARDIQIHLALLDANRPSLPLELLQIDDGYEQFVGDWFTFKPGFPDGVAPLAGEIHDGGLTPGLWLAPFILDRRSRFFREHQEFILRNRRGQSVNAGWGWNAFTAAMDLTAPGALEESTRAVKVATHDWGFPYLKLDFLYAAALDGVRYDPTRTRAQIMRLGMKALRDTAGEKTFLLGCGLPLGPGIGLVNAMRIGADVSGSWQPQINGVQVFLKGEPHLPSARNSIQNTLTRAPLHHRWWINDPDCLLLRPDTKLTQAEIRALATAIGVTGGSLLLSDNLATLPPERLRIAQVLLPLPGKRAEVLDLLRESTPRRLRLMLSGPQGNWAVIARFNWQDRAENWSFEPVEFNLPEDPCWVSSFWDETISFYQPGIPVNMPAIPPHGAALLAIFPATVTQNGVYLGGNLHFSQGTEVSDWQTGNPTLHFSLNLGRQANGFFRLWLPAAPRSARINKVPLVWRQESDQTYCFELALDQQAAIHIEF